MLPHIFPEKLKVNPTLVGVFVLAAFALRVAYLVWVGPQLTWPDESRFYSLTQFLVVSWSFPEAMKAHDMPLTPLLLAVLVRATGCGLFGMKLFICTLSALTVVPVGMIAGRLYASRWSVYLACAMTCVYPFFIFYSRLLLSESLFLFFLTCFFAGLICLPGRMGAWLSGIFAGLSHLVRPTLLYFLPVAWCWMVWKGGWKIRHAVTAAIVCTVIIAPWVGRNVLVLGAPVLATASSGHVLWEGNNPWNPHGATAQTDWGYLDNAPANLSELARDNWEKDQAVAFIKGNPGFFLRAALHKFARFWNVLPNHPSLQRGLYMWGSVLSFGPILLLSLAAPFVLRRAWRDVLLLWGFAGYYTLLHMVTIGSIRYRLPLEPLLLAMAAAVLVRLFDVSARRFGIDARNTQGKAE